VEAPEARVLAAFAERDALAGRAVEWEAGTNDAGRGVAAGVDERGNLVIEADGGERLSLGSGEVQLRLG
jgi:biotin-(acetyl-CoA carboxylase) ligase